MRWSLLSLVALLAVLIAEVTALPTPQDGSSELSLERLAVTKLKATGKAKAGKKGKNPAPKRVPKGKDAGHIFEAQTMWHADRKGGHSSTTLGPALKTVTDHINEPKNTALLDPKTNRAKGRAHTAVQSGKSPAKDKNVAEYLKQTRAAGKATTDDVDKNLKAHRVKGRHISKKPERPSLVTPFGLSVL